MHRVLAYPNLDPAGANLPDPVEESPVESCLKKNPRPTHERVILRIPGAWAISGDSLLYFVLILECNRR